MFSKLWREELDGVGEKVFVIEYLSTWTRVLQVSWLPNGQNAGTPWNEIGDAKFPHLLSVAAALAKHLHAEAEEKARIKAEQEELRQREKARRERDLKRREYLTKKVEAYEGYRRLVTLQTPLGPQARENGDNPFNRIVSVLHKFVETEGRQFESAAVADKVIDLKLFSEDDEI